MKQDRVTVRFIKAWGHPTRNEVYGPPQVFSVTKWQADHLISTGYAELATKKTV